MIAGYEVEVQELNWALGSGYVAYARALKGCVADGATQEEALANLADAIECWLKAARAKGRAVTREPEAAHVLLDVP